MNILIKNITVITGMIFMYAGCLKAMDIQAFAEAIMGYGLINYKASVFLATVLPYIEIVTGFCLTVGIKIKSALAVILFLLSGFIVAVGFAMINNININCGCFSTHEVNNNLWFVLIRNITLWTGCFFSFIKWSAINVSNY